MTGVPKGFTRGTHRVVDPRETLARLRPILPAVGITRLANVTGLDTIGIPVVMACRPNARSLAVSQGKGLTLDAAKASAAMEALELWHAERITLPLKFASERELRYSHPLMKVGALPRLSVSRYHEDVRILWVEGVDLVSNSPRWVPFETVQMNITLPLPPGSGSFPLNSNGLASGNCLAEAINHALAEVVERDAVSVLKADNETGRDVVRIDLATIDDPDCRHLLRLFARADMLVAVWDATSDVGIPVFTCTIVDREPIGHRTMCAAQGQGCHPCREIALLRALTEAAQSRVTMIAGSRDDVPRGDYELSRSLDVLDRIRKGVLRGTPSRNFYDVATHVSETFEGDMAWMLSRLANVGIEEVIAVDLDQNLGFSVVRVIVPGLEGVHGAPGYVPGPRARARMEAA